MKRSTLKRMILAALFLAIGYVLPFLTGGIKEIGNMLAPMHLPVLLCGIVCGWKYGLVVGAVMPVTRSLMFGMPRLYPNAVAMAFELATYGLIVGILYDQRQRQSLPRLYVSLVSAMLAGRLVWGAVEALLLGVFGSGFTLSMFVAGAFLNSLPGILLQLVLIPALTLALQRARLLPLQE
ncbi:MAG: ECF transporter S component [Ruminococcaceae bacterium]|nr:ECF transporter S component [Oscillospiraceae bacterium]